MFLYDYLILNNDNIYFKSELAANNGLFIIFKIILDYYQKINLADLFKKKNFNFTRPINFPTKVAKLNLLI